MLSAYSFIVTMTVLLINLIFEALFRWGALDRFGGYTGELWGYAIALGGFAFNFIALILGITGVARTSKKRILGQLAILMAIPQLLIEALEVFPLLPWPFNVLLFHS